MFGQQHNGTGPFCESGDADQIHDNSMVMFPARLGLRTPADRLNEEEAYIGFCRSVFANPHIVVLHRLQEAGARTAFADPAALLSTHASISRRAQMRSTFPGGGWLQISSLGDVKAGESHDIDRGNHRNPAITAFLTWILTKSRLYSGQMSSGCFGTMPGTHKQIRFSPTRRHSTREDRS